VSRRILFSVVKKLLKQIIHKEIRNLRIKLGYTQEDMAKKLGTAQQYVSKIENGHENFSMDTLARIADVFGKGLVIKLK